MAEIFELVLPYLGAFVGALALTLALTPVVRETNRRLGMVDKPDPRRINKVPIPRGGGLALVIGTFASYAIFLSVSDCPAFAGLTDSARMRILVLSLAVAALGLADDRWGLSPKVKLLGQVAIALGVWWWAGLGFARLWPHLPAWADCAMTVFWVVGAVNAFNLIDGLDGLASGLAFIAVLGMAGALIFVGRAQSTYFYFAFAGGLLGFLRYNYNPASVFLGDCGSMFIGFTLSTLPLASQAQDSFLVSVGVPMLAMGVPIFDSALAILRRSIRRMLRRRSGVDAGNDKVMGADADHLHHRILRSVGLNQRKAAWLLYAFACFLVLTGLSGMFLRSKAAGLWLFAVAVAAVVIFRDMARIELFDAGRLLRSVAWDRRTSVRRRWAKLTIPFYVGFDLLALTGTYCLVVWAFKLPLERPLFRVAMPIRLISTFVCLCFFRTYVTAWSRAMGSNYVRLLLACGFGAVFGAVGIYYAPRLETGGWLKATTLAYFAASFIALVLVRMARPVVRDLFYAFDCSRLKARKDVSRILVYGSGLRYRAFRRELVRTTAANDRMIVGLIDDDLLLRGHYIGGLKVLGTINQAPEIINAVNADAVVIACDVSEGWLRVVRQILAPTGVRVTHFGFQEKEV